MTGLGAVDLPEVGEQVGGRLGVDTDAPVDDRQADVATLGTRRHVDGVPVGRELHRVVQQLVEDSSQVDRIGQDRRQAAVEEVAELAAVVAGPPLLQGLGHHRGQVDRFGFEDHTTGVEASEVHDHADDPLQASGGVEDLPGEPLGGLSPDVSAGEHVGVALDRGDRGPELVGDVGEELRLHPLDLDLAADVAEDEDATEQLAVG